jgi:hypothetical protein
MQPVFMAVAASIRTDAASVDAMGSRHDAGSPSMDLEGRITASLKLARKMHHG